ncbi:hypothetical protein HU200_066446 [Digitaria exilis]|uniref:Pectinesterase n=1 Tax=Digitaria exilis TaxID=1010633 RepID=A0A835DTU6_9POAL|nr:hypothetical protein HU200_066446 [Digitaria exilis]
MRHHPRSTMARPPAATKTTTTRRPLLVLVATVLASSLLPPPSDAAAAAANPAAAFDSWIAKNQENYIVNMALYAKKAAGDGGKTLDASLSAAEEKKTTYVIDPSGKGDYATITAAIADIPNNNDRRVILDLKPGATFREKLLVNLTQPYVTFKSDPTNPATIAWNDTAATPGKDGKARRNSR